MKLFLRKSALCFLGLLILLCYSCAPKQVVTGPVEEPKVIEVKPAEPEPIETKPVETKPVETKPPETKPVEAKPLEPKPVEPSTVVGKIADYVFTRAELETQVMRELRTRPDEYVTEDGSVDARAVLEKMIAEKAMLIDAREQNFLEEKDAKAKLKRFKDMMLANLLLKTELQEKVRVTDAEIDQKIASDPNLNRDQAKARLEKQRALILTNQFYEQLHEKLHVQKLKLNFARAAQIYQRLLFAPKEKQRIRFVKKTQVEEDLTPEEKSIVLGTFDGGQVTLEDWLETLCLYSPPRRPRDLHTPAGVERFVDRILRLPVFVAEARLRGLDNDEGYVKQVTEREDATLFRKAMVAKYEQIKKPTEEEITAYFNENKEKFRTPDRLKIDQIWCQDFKTAQKVKELLRSANDFQSLKQEYSFAKEDKPVSISVSREGMLFKDLLGAEPNEIVGPIRGFYLDRGKRPAEWQVKWRVVKILQKQPGAAQESVNGMERQVSSVIRNEQREALLAKYRKELLEKYPYEIYPEGIKDINPLNIP